MKTAEEFLNQYDQEYFEGAVFAECAYRSDEVRDAMIAFAKMHLENFISEMDAYDIFRYESLIEETFNNIK